MLRKYLLSTNCLHKSILRILTTSQLSTKTLSVKRKSTKITPTLLEDKFNMEWPKITLFGDSITRRSMDPDNGCWGSMIAHRVGNYFDVDVRGFEGYNSKRGLELMPQLFPKSYLDKVEVFIPFFGHNDPWKFSTSHNDQKMLFESAALFVPLDQYEDNMRQMIKYLENNGVDKEKVILITPTWYHSGACTKYMLESGLPPLTKDLDQAKGYSEAVLRIARDNNISAIDFFETSLKHDPLEDMFCDGLHFSKIGAKMLYDLLMPVVEKKLVTSFKKPLADLWHSTPFDQIPEIKSSIETYHKSLKEI